MEQHRRRNSDNGIVEQLKNFESELEKIVCAIVAGRNVSGVISQQSSTDYIKRFESENGAYRRVDSFVAKNGSGFVLYALVKYQCFNDALANPFREIEKIDSEKIDINNAVRGIDHSALLGFYTRTIDFLAAQKLPWDEAIITAYNFLRGFSSLAVSSEGPNAKLSTYCNGFEVSLEFSENRRIIQATVVFRQVPKPSELPRGGYF